jgi:alpha-N-arabinofuranosidase
MSSTHLTRGGLFSLVILCLAVLLLSLATAGEAAAPKLVIDVTKTREPINPFIYGQFIEHLGRCIYGGIWAEMLEDRKFYFPITADYDPYVSGGDMAENPQVPVVGASPWQIVGPSQSVTMVQEDSFVGRHTPRVEPGSGIRQKDLGLVRGKRYVGHVWLKAAGPSTTAIITLGSAEGRTIVEAGGDRYIKHPLDFTATESTDEASLTIAVEQGPCLVGTASLMPADNVAGMRADTLKLLKQLNAPMYRWPGGNFVSGYDWRDGIGDRDRRPPRKNPAWTGVEHNDFGLDEFIAFCRELDTEPLIAVNTGFGDAYSAAQQVEYTNGSTDTIGGRWRAENGHPEPYDVTWWCIGNEMYGRWQLGHMQLRHYTQKHNEFVEYMRRVDPTIQVIAVGALGSRHPGEERGWSFGMLQQCADHMDLISEHFYVGAKDDVIEHIAQVTEAIKNKAEGHHQLRQQLAHLQGKDITIAMDEWNYWHRPYYYGELGCIYRLRDALGIAAGIHQYARHTDTISMAHYAQTVNVIGCIKTTKTEAGFATTGLPLMLYRQHYGTVPVDVSWEGEAPAVDIAAAWTEDRQALTIGAVNPYPATRRIDLRVKGTTLAGSGVVWTIAGESPDPMLYNEPGKPPRVSLTQKPFDGLGDVLELPAMSVSLWRVDVR